jgi:hypothetical protein
MCCVGAFGCGQQQAGESRDVNRQRTVQADAAGEASGSWPTAQGALHRNGSRFSVRPLRSFAISQHGGLLAVPVTLGEEEHLFMLDTGTTFNTFDLALRRHLGEPVQQGTGKTGSGDIAVSAFRPPNALVKGLELGKDEPVVCTDLNMVRYATGQDIQGILGVPFFKRYIVQLDWDRALLHILEPDAPPDPEWGDALPLSFDELEGPVLEAVLPGGQGLPLLVDVGLDATGTLDDELFSRLANDEALRITGSRIVATAGGNVRRCTGRLRYLQVGRFEHRGLIVGQGNSNKIGLAYLSRYKATFDFRNA